MYVYIYTYVYIYICMYMYVHEMYIHMYIYICVVSYIYIYNTYIYIYTYDIQYILCVIEKTPLAVPVEKTISRSSSGASCAPHKPNGAPFLGTREPFFACRRVAKLGLIIIIYHLNHPKHLYSYIIQIISIIHEKSSNIMITS